MNRLCLYNLENNDEVLIDIRPNLQKLKRNKSNSAQNCGEQKCIFLNAAQYLDIFYCCRY